MEDFALGGSRRESERYSEHQSCRLCDLCEGRCGGRGWSLRRRVPGQHQLGCKFSGQRNLILQANWGSKEADSSTQGACQRPPTLLWKQDKWGLFEATKFMVTFCTTRDSQAKHEFKPSYYTHKILASLFLSWWVLPVKLILFQVFFFEMKYFPVVTLSCQLDIA